MSFKKQYLKTRPVCKVTFRVSKEAANNADTIHIVGDFNDWDIHQSPMKKLKNGSFTITLDLPINQEYQFRYLFDHNIWENDWEADKYLPSGISSSENSVVMI